MPAVRLTTLVGLARACHPLPCLAVTAFTAVYGASLGLSGGRGVLLAAAVLTGQLSVGWCNDWVDVARDVAAGRTDKPVPAGLVRVVVLRTATFAALVACVVLSLALGVAPGLAHLTAVGSAWAYNLYLKGTALSPLPFLVSFGLLPAVVTLAAPDGAWPSPSVVAGAAMMGVGAHFANTVADTAADRATGVRGLPQRLGPRGSLVVTGVMVAGAAAVLRAGLPGGSAAPSALLLAGAVVALAGSVAVLLTGGGAPSRIAFRLTLAAVGLVVAGVALAGLAAAHP